jgi:hypothetical protein
MLQQPLLGLKHVSDRVGRQSVAADHCVRNRAISFLFRETTQVIRQNV